MDYSIHIRCSRCQRHLAGPLSHVESPKQIGDFGDFAVGFDEFFSVREILFSTSQLFDFTFESENDLYVHPQWYEGWRRDWPDFARGAVQRRLFAIAIGYGCCGPQGIINCSCGIQLGRVMADCIGPQWMVLFDSRIDRSDRSSGDWVLHADAEAPVQWYEDSGELIDNRRNGEWERWLVVPRLESVQRRNKKRELVLGNQESIDRRLVASSQWSDGKVVCEVIE